MNNDGAIQRAQLFADVANLKQHMKISRANNMEVIKDQIELNEHLIKHSSDIKNILEGCLNMLQVDEELGKRMDEISKRIDIVNKRLRKLEQGRLAQ